MPLSVLSSRRTPSRTVAPRAGNFHLRFEELELRLLPGNWLLGLSWRATFLCSDPGWPEGWLSDASPGLRSASEPDRLVLATRPTDSDQILIRGLTGSLTRPEPEGAPVADPLSSF